jgi:hypothetical protein
MASPLILLDEFLPMNALGLGSLVESLKNPVMDAYTPKRPLPPDAVLPMPAKSFRTLFSSSNSTSFRLTLTRLLGSSYTVQNESDVSLQSIRVNRYQLKQPKEIFRELCLEDEKARQWLNDGIQAGNKSYLVVELQTAEDATISLSKKKMNKTDADITRLVSTIAAGGVGVPGVGAALDSGGGIGYSGSKGTHKSFILEGESIFAIGYRKVMWKSWGLNWKEIDKAILDKDITWSILGRKRGREEEAELVSVDLADDLDARDDIEAVDGEDEDNEDDIDDVAELLKHRIEVDGQTYLILSGAGVE